MNELHLNCCVVLDTPGDNIPETIRCLQDAHQELSLYIVSMLPEADTTCGRITWLYPGTKVFQAPAGATWHEAVDLILPELPKGELLLLLRSGVTFESGLPGSMVRFMTDNPQAAALTPRVKDSSGQEVFYPRRQPRISSLIGLKLHRLPGPFRSWYRDLTMSDAAMIIPSRVACCSAHCVMIRTDVFHHVFGIDPHYKTLLGIADMSRNILEHGHILYHPSMCVTAEDAAKPPLLLPLATDAFRYFWKWGMQ